MSAGYLYSVVIPVYNSEHIVSTTVSRVCDFFENNSMDFELILVNDGSSDGSWRVISELAERHASVTAINLLKNYGQHAANMCGFQHAIGDYVITMDDDLQNPPGEIAKLINALEDNCDLVVGRFSEKKHAWYRRIGSKIVGYINRKIFHIPQDFVLTNFRIVRSDVVKRVCQYNGSYPYIPGLILQNSSSRKNVLVNHNAREIGVSNYNVFRIAKLVSEILFNYSSYPLRVVAAFGLFVSLVSFLLALFYLVNAMVMGSSVPGWTTVVFMLAFFNGMLLLMLGMLGEYILRLVHQTSDKPHFEIKEISRG